MLPSGRTLGHRSLRVYYSQHARPKLPGTQQSLVVTEAAQVRQKLNDPSRALVPRAGGHGAFGKGLQVMKARNSGEAAWARHQGRSFQDQRIKEEMRTRVGFIRNNQKRAHITKFPVAWLMSPQTSAILFVSSCRRNVEKLGLADNYLVQ